VAGCGAGRLAFVPEGINHRGVMEVGACARIGHTKIIVGLGSVLRPMNLILW